MIRDFEIQKLKEEYPELFEEFSSEFFEFLFSEKIASEIAQICLKNGIQDEEKIEEIAYLVAAVLLGELPEENLARTLEKGVGIDHETAKEISIQFKHLIFSKAPKVYSETTQSKKPLFTKPIDKPMDLPSILFGEEFIKFNSEKPFSQNKDIYKDIYREPID